MTDQNYECPFCHATGIYRGTLEPPNIGVVCNVCSGSGCSAVRWPNAVAFITRRQRTDVQLVYVSISERRGKYIGKPVSVEHFYRGIMPS